MKSFILHNSQDLFFREPFGAVPSKSDVKLRVEINTALPVYSAKLSLINDDGVEQQLEMQLEENTGDRYVYAVKISVPSIPGLLWYYFMINIDNVNYFYGNNQNGFGGIGSISHSIPVYYQISVYKEGAKTPDWFKDAIMYQIFVDRFNNGNKSGRVLNPRSNCLIYGSWDDTPCYIKDCDTGGILRWDFFGGNLQGIIDKLDYLSSLGITVLYLNPIFDAPSNHKYDTADYKKIDQMFGDEAVFKELCEKAKDRGIYILLDGVFSHTGCDSRYFNKFGNYCDIGAYQSQESPYYSWYRFCDGKDEYECWWGIDTMPNVDEMNPKYREFIISGEGSVIKHWMKEGAKGWRLDVADELPDEFIQELRASMKELDADSVLIGEVWEDASNKMSYGKRRKYLQGEELDSIMNYPFRNILVDFLLYRQTAEHTKDALMSLKENYPAHNYYSCMNIIGTHDIPRILTILGEAPPEEQLTTRQKEVYRLDNEKRALGISRLKLLSLIQMTFPGTPCIYYGDEAGLEGYKDPLNRRTYPWEREDEELLSWYKKVTAVRRLSSVFTTGSFYPVYVSEDVLAYIRTIEGNKDEFGNVKKNGLAITAVNRSRESSKEFDLDLNEWIKDISLYYEKRFYDLLDDSYSVSIYEGKLNISLAPLSGRILYND